MGLIRLYAIGLVVLTLIYIWLMLSGSWQCKKRLEAEYDAGGVEGTRDDYVDTGLQAYQGSLRRKLLLGVYAVPAIVIAALVYFVNFK